MKKTKILLVLAIAMLAMFAMSACGLVTDKIDRVEFEVMPKNYFEQTKLGTDGITVNFTAYVGETAHPTTITVKSNDAQTINVAGFEVDVTVSGYSTDLGPQELIVATTGAIVTYEYRVCKEITDLAGLTTAGENGGYYILGADIESDAGKDGSVLNIKAAPFVLYGDNHNVTATNTEISNNGRLVNVIGGDFADPTDKAGLFEFNNVNFIGGTYQDGENVIYYPQRGMNFANLDGATININACTVYGKYAINFPAGTAANNNITVNISNGSTANGWAAINSYTNNSVFNIDDVTLVGTNYYSGSSNSFATIVFDGYGWDFGNGKANYDPGVVGFNNVVNISNCVIDTNALGDQEQFLVSLQYHAAKNVINITNCVNSNGNAIANPVGLLAMHDNCDGDQYDDEAKTKFVWTAKKLTEAQKNKIYINGTLFTADNL